MSDDFDFETPTGIPDQLPVGERIMWQGSPRWAALVRHVFHADKIVAYFGVLIAARLIVAWYDGLPLSDVFATIVALSIAAALALAIISAMAWQAARTTVYTLTTRRVVMRYGMALPVTLNIPLTRISNASLAARKDATGDIVLKPEAGTRLAYIMLWPHVRAWHLSHPEPSLRCVPDADQVAVLLGEALQATASYATTSVVRVRPVGGTVSSPTYHPATPLAAAE
jgi:hypothetical protein